MSTVTASEMAGKAPNLCMPQSFVIIYIVNKTENDTEVTDTNYLLPETISNEESNTIDIRINALVITDKMGPKFLIHKNIICHYSPYFSAAFNGNFVEGQTQTMTLDVDEKAFGILVNWLYNQVIISETVDAPLLVPLTRLWIMAEEFLMPDLQDQAMKEIYTGLLSTTPGRGFAGDFGLFTEIASQHGS